MMLKAAILPSLCCVAVLGACAPMEQAPLIYTSGVEVGLHVGTGPDKTTPEINIGVNQVDAAYVPVAVAKYCDPKTASENECVNKIYQLYLINGRSKVNSSNPPPVDKLQKAVAAYVAASNAVDSDNSTISSLSLRQAALVPPASLPPADAEKLTKAQADLPTAQASLEAKQQALVDLVTGETGSNAADSQHDALSVFGTFDSNAGGNGGTSPSGSVVVGHTFSTGIAAQNLTRGQEISAASAAYANCLTAVTSLIPKIDTTKTSVDSMIADCGRIQSILKK